MSFAPEPSLVFFFFFSVRQDEMFMRPLGFFQVINAYRNIFHAQSPLSVLSVEMRAISVYCLPCDLCGSQGGVSLHLGRLYPALRK